MRQPWTLVAALAALLPFAAGCALQDFYGKEYVLHDPTAAAAASSNSGPSAAEPGAAGRGAAAVDPAAADPDATAAEDRQPDEAAVAIARIFELEQVLDELNRAIRDGIGPTAQLIDKRNAVELELSLRKRAAGPDYQQERLRRIEALSRFATRPR